MFPLGKNFGEMWDDCDQINYVIQLLIAANPATGSIVLFDKNYSVGSSIELMSRNNQKTVDSTRADTCELCDQLDSKNNLFALYINCAGRGVAWSGHNEEEADIMRAEFTPDSGLKSWV